jgi:hypothetical protein
MCVEFLYQPKQVVACGSVERHIGPAAERIQGQADENALGEFPAQSVWITVP